MKVLQLDVNKIEFEPIEPESSSYESAEKKPVVVTDALVMLVAVEKGDTEEHANKAVADSIAFAKKQGVKRLVIYPFAHLSSNLESPKEALAMLDLMRTVAAEEKGIEVFSAPFGWNKRLSLMIKGHPLAEQSRNYGESAGAAQNNRPKAHRKVDLSIVKKSDWSGLPDTDHRTIGEKMDLYSFQEVSPGMVYWHNKGYIVYKELVRFVRGKEEEYDYEEISTPQVANLALWHVSGHIEKYKENMFVFDSGSGEELGLRAMGCPSAIMVYKARSRSYRDLPLRFAEFDTLFRNEISGALTGLLRVRQLTQDDAHIFLAEDQIEEEISVLLRMAKEVYEVFGMKYELYLSTMPDQHIGDEELWRKAEAKLKSALDKNGMKYGIKDKDGAFYGPKIDGDVLDAMGRRWQCLTIQLDYQQPIRFKLTYANDKGEQSTPVIVHRTLIGSFERFIGVLVEHYQGKFPTWLAPTQVRIVSISEAVNDYASKVHKELKGAGIRADLDISDKTLEYKIRDAKLQQVPYTIVLGKKEQEAGTISVRNRDGKQTNAIAIADFIGKVRNEAEERSQALSY